MLAGTFVVLAVVGGSGQGNSEIRVIGFGLAVGILIDTFVVRTVLVPSTVELLGRWNWWPSRMGRLPAITPGPPTDGTAPGADPPTGGPWDGDGRTSSEAATPGIPYGPTDRSPS